MEDRTHAILSMMLNAFPQSQNTEMTVLLMTFDVALEGIPDTSIVETAKAYLQGKIADHRAAFAPSCAEFALNARKHHYDNLPEKPMIAAPVERKVNPAYRAVMIKKLELFSCALKTGRTNQLERWNRRHPITIPMYEDELVK
jgi:hypothetical protein